MRPRLPFSLWPFLCLAALLLGLAAAAPGPDRPPPGDSATHPLIALSLLHDRDLAWDERDHARAYRLWNAGPHGLALAEAPDGTLRYARPIAYPLAILPFVAVLGPSGPAVLNTLLLLAMLFTALWLYTSGGSGAGDEHGPAPGWPVWAFVFGSFLLSFTLAHAWRSEPALFEAAGLFFAFALARYPGCIPRRLAGRRSALPAAGAGLLLGAAAVSAPVLAIAAVLAAVALGTDRRWRALAALAGGAVLAAGLLAAAEQRLAGRWSAWGGAAEHLTFQGAFPGDRGVGAEAAAEPLPEPGPDRRAAVRLREVGWMVAGRHGGALPYYPFAVLAFLLCMGGRGDAVRRDLLLQFPVLLLALALIGPLASLGGGGVFHGHRWLAVVAPALALLPSPGAFGGSGTAGRSAVRPFARWGTAAAFGAAAIWTVPALASALAATVAPAAAVPAAPAHLRLASFRALPLELSLLPRLPGYELRSWGGGTWSFPLAAVYAAEGHPHGVWLRGGAEAELVLASPVPLDAVAFTAFSPLPGNVLTAEAGVEEVIVRFDSPGKRAGVPVVLPVEPAVRGLGFFPRAPDDAYYRVRVTTSEGWVPARRDPGSADPRYLSTFLSFTGEPP